MSRPRHAKAFTLLELLVVIAIMALLVVFVAISLRAVGSSASRADSINSLRQMALAYASYSADHRHQLMPGYIGADLFEEGEVFEDLKVSISTATGSVDLEPEDKQSYVWRLAPYLDDAWRTFFADLNDPGILSQVQAEYDSGTYGPAGGGSIPEGISERPAYGMNSIFVGGDSVHGGSYATERNPWTGTVAGETLAARRTSQVKNPARLVIFAPSALAATAPTQVYETTVVGFCELRPPFLELVSVGGQLEWHGAHWIVGARGEVAKGRFFGAEEGGLPVDRTDAGTLPVAHLDGSAAGVALTELARDMRYWSPFEAGQRPTKP